MRLECNRPSFKKLLENTYDKVCVNCGSADNIEWHHIVPIADGGTNNIRNIVPLCKKCHNIAHGSVNIRERYRAKYTGRKRKVPENYKEIIFNYLRGDYGLSACKQMLDIQGAGKLTDKVWYKEMLKEYGIDYHKNRIDLLKQEKCKNKDNSNRIIAYVVFKDGTLIGTLGNGRKVNGTKDILKQF